MIKKLLLSLLLFTSIASYAQVFSLDENKENRIEISAKGCNCNHLATQSGHCPSIDGLDCPLGCNSGNCNSNPPSPYTPIGSGAILLTAFGTVYALIKKRK